MKPICRLLFYLTLTSILGAEAPSDTGTEAPRARISLREVTNSVLADNPAIKEALRKWNAARARISQAAAWDDIRVSGESRVRRYVDIPPNAFMDQVASVEQLVPITGKNLARARAARSEALSVFEEVRRQQLDVVAAARSSFFRLANLYAQLDINDENNVSLRQLAEISRARYEAGTSSAADVLVAETDSSKLLEARRELERQLSSEQAQLNALMNRDAFAPLGAPAEAAVKTPELSVTKLRPLLLAHRPEIKMAEAKIDIERSKLQLAQREWIPDPALMVKTQRYNDTGQGVSELDAGVSFTVPWVNFKKYAAGVREARENVGAAEQALDRSEKEALRLLRDQLAKIDAARDQLALFSDKIVPQARQAFEANRLSYESGKVSFLDWITAQRTLRDIESTACQRQADYQIAIVELEAILGAQLYPLPDQSVDQVKRRTGDSAKPGVKR
jgi:cobalt-zinc-cadmium efflux system outer membrane protein